MSTSLDQARVSQFLQRKFPEWSKATKLTTSRREDSDVFGSGSETTNNDYNEFFLSTNWVLRPKGFNELSEELEKSTVNHEITFDTQAGMPKIRCSRDQQDVMMILASNTIERIVNTDSNSEKALALETWRVSLFTPDELREFETSRAPRSIIECRYQSKWAMSKDSLTINDLLPGNSLSAIQQSTGVVLVLYNHGSATWIGADSEEKISLIKKRLNTLVKYFEPRQKQKLEHFFNAEEVRRWNGEFRYLNNVNHYILSSFFLDRTLHKSSDYSKLFSRGATIRISSANLKAGTYMPAPPNKITSATSGKDTEAPFKAFQNWEYRGKTLKAATSEPKSDTPIFPEQSDFHDIPSWVDHLHESQPMPNVNTYRRPAEEISRDTGNVSVSCDKPGAHDSISNQPTATTNIDDEPGPLMAEAIPEIEEFKANERLTNLELQMAALTQEIGDTPSTDITRDSAAKAQSVSEVKDSSENSELSKNLTLLPKMPPKGSDRLEDPFRNLYLEVRSTITAKKSECLIDLEESTYEGKGRVYHNTMLQKAGAKAKGAKKRPGKSMALGSTAGRGNLTSANPQESSKSSKVAIQKYLDPELLSDINRALAEVLNPLRICTGIISVKAQIGRFCFTNINKTCIQVKPGASAQYQEPPKLKKTLDLNCIASQALWFTKILSIHGGDANYLSELKETDGTRMWTPDSNGRRSIYEFHCEAATADTRIFFFVLEVDTADFSHRIRHVDEHAHMLFVHCVKRSWDFQLEISKTQNLDNDCENFARDLVDSLRIIPQKSGIPHLEFSIKRGYQVGVVNVKTRNTATCTRRRGGVPALKTNESGSCVLEISEVHDMDLKVEDLENGSMKYYSEAFPGNPSKGHPSMWFEASIQSNAMISAFQENKTLELGDETEWSFETLRNARAFEDLVTAASDTVKQMDGVGYWSENNQSSMIHGRPTEKTPGDQKHRSPGAYKVVYW